MGKCTVMATMVTLFYALKRWPDAVSVSPWAPNYTPSIPRPLSSQRPLNAKPQRVLLVLEWHGELLWPGASNEAALLSSWALTVSLDGTGLAGCQRTQNLNQTQARGVTAKVNVAASRKREHINKPQTVKMSQKGSLGSNPPILPLQPQQYSCPSSSLKGSHSLWATRKKGWSLCPSLPSRQSPVFFCAEQRLGRVRAFPKSHVL